MSVPASNTCFRVRAPLLPVHVDRPATRGLQGAGISVSDRRRALPGNVVLLATTRCVACAGSRPAFALARARKASTCSFLRVSVRIMALAAAARDIDDPGLARERAALAWTRSALTMAASGALIARAAFVGHLAWLTVFSAVAIATLSVLTWHHGQVICREHREPGIPQNLQTVAFGLLTAATVLIAGVAILVTIMI